MAFKKRITPKFIGSIFPVICDYGCGKQAEWFYSTANKYCCSRSYNSCQGKKDAFSALDHSERTAKSLNTRIKTGITKTVGAKTGKTNVSSGHYIKLADQMREHWSKRPWTTNYKCPILNYKDTTIPYQGSFEFDFLQSLEDDLGLPWLIDNISRGPGINYKFDNKDKLYLPDFIVGNMIYEIKSSWTWNNKGSNLDLERQNKAKLNAAIDAGYDVILVLDKEKMRWIKDEF